MRHEMSLRGGIFNDAVDLFDTKLRDVLNTLLRQGLSEGSVTLKVNVELWNVGEQDENTLFDIVEGGVQDGAQPDRDGTPG